MNAGRQSKQLSFDFVEPKGSVAVRSHPVKVRGITHVVYNRAEADLFVRRLSDFFNGKLREVRFTANRSTIISYKQVSGRYHVSVQRCFIHADRRVIGALASYVKKRNSYDGRIIDDFVQLHMPAEAAARRRTKPNEIRTNGRHYDLQRIFDELRRDYFAAGIDAAITWGPAMRIKKRRRARRRSIHLGSFLHSERLISIHPALDEAFVPEYVIRAVLYHEMLHATLPTKKINGREYSHHAEFKQLERNFPDYEKSEKWLVKNLERLFKTYDARIRLMRKAARA